MKFNPNPQLLIPKLTALWAVSESGLGGLMHAAKIPFSGIFLGSFAVIIVSMIAFHATHKFKSIAQATLLVIIIKAIASPHSPIAAYLAVSFQGILGALIYQIFGLNRVSSVFYGILALLQSAFQKIIMLTLIFGMRIWDAMATFFNEIATQFNQSFIQELPFIALMVYSAIYLIVGVLAGIIGFNLPKSLIHYAKMLQIPKANIHQNTAKKPKSFKFIFIIFALIFSMTIFLFTGNSRDAIFIFIRTIAALIFFLYIFNPLFKWILQHWVKHIKSQRKQKLEEILSLTPQIRSNAELALQMSKSYTWWPKKLKNFLLIWLSLSLYYEES
ncbi:MAG: hypothetical protein Q4G27_08890 [Flavobacteriaceae bacterium]|nr:hypothetical protein [Flavobacteriaceae bacterium]